MRVAGNAKRFVLERRFIRSAHPLNIEEMFISSINSVGNTIVEKPLRLLREAGPRENAKLAGSLQQDDRWLARTQRIVCPYLAGIHNRNLRRRPFRFE